MPLSLLFLPLYFVYLFFVICFFIFGSFLFLFFPLVVLLCLQLVQLKLWRWLYFSKPTQRGRFLNWNVTLGFRKTLNENPRREFKHKQV